METKSSAKLSLTKREIITLMSIVGKEKERYDAIDYSQLDDDKASDVGDEHEVIGGVFLMLKTAYSDSFE